MTARKKYPKEFKLDAISLVLDQGYCRSEAARSLDIDANMFCRWIKEHQSEDGRRFEVTVICPRINQRPPSAVFMP